MCGRPFCLAVVLALVFLVVVLLAVLIVLVHLLVLILVIHAKSSKFVLADFRTNRLPDFLGFILGFEQKAGKKSRHHGSGNAAGAGF